MVLSCSTRGLVEPKRPGQGAVDICNSDFKSVTLDLRAYLDEKILKEVKRKTRYSAQEKDFKELLDDPEVLTTRVRDLKRRFDGKDVSIDAVITPAMPLDRKYPEIKPLVIELTKRAIDLAFEVGAGYIVIPPISVRNSSQEEKECNRDFYKMMIEYRKNKGKTEPQILLINQTVNFNGHFVRGAFSDPKEAVSWIDDFNKEAGEEMVSFCLDIGTANLCAQYIDEMIFILDQHIKMILVSDNDGISNQKLMPLSYKAGNSVGGDWSGALTGLRDMGFDGLMTMEIGDTVTAYGVLLRPELMKLAIKVGEYLVWQINMENALKKYKNIVLFGAGNMCQSFMCAYGDKYPPLYTCDNNKALWGTEIVGLRVEPPEKLLTLPEETGVVICNLYYRDIEYQLKEMGIKNIEFFSDEFFNRRNMNRVFR